MSLIVLSLARDQVGFTILRVGSCVRSADHRWVDRSVARSLGRLVLAFGSVVVLI